MHVDQGWGQLGSQPPTLLNTYFQPLHTYPQLNICKELDVVSRPHTQECGEQAWNEVNGHSVNNLTGSATSTNTLATS